MPDQMTILAPEGMLGYGIPARSMEEGLKRQPDVLAVDAGSTDPGPYYLGAGVPFTNRRAFTRDQLLENVWGYDFAGDSRTVDVHVSWLRQKIEAEPSKPARLITVRGVGYRFD